ATFFAYFTAIGNTIAILIQTFITPRHIRRLGLGTANLIYPLTSLIGLGAMAIFPAFLPAVFLRFNNRNLQESIRNIINALLYNAVPTRIRGRLGAFVAGQVVAFASILSGVFLLIINPAGFALFPLSLRAVALFSLVVGAAYLATGFVLRREYGAALRKMLEDRTLGLFRYAQEGFGTIDAQSLALLHRNLREGDGEVCLFAASMLAESGKPEALDAILAEIPRRTGAVRAHLLRLLGGAPGARESAQVRELMAAALRSEDPGERLAAMDGIERLGFIEEHLDQIQENLRHPSPEVRVRAVRLLVRSDDLFYLASGLQTLHAMLERGGAAEQVSALNCITELGNPRFIRRIVPYLQSPRAEVREAAVNSIERLVPAGGGDPAQLEAVLQITLADPSPSVRRCAVRLMGARGNRLDFERLLASLVDPESGVRHEAITYLKEMKRRRAIFLEGGTLIALAGRWLRPQGNGQGLTAEELLQGLGAFSLDHLREVYEVVAQIHAIEREADLDDVFMLRKVLWDKVHERQRLLVELLGVLGDEKTVDTVSTSLARGEASFRALAIETLSTASAQGAARQIILLLEPLLTPGSTAEKLAEGRKSWTLGQPSLSAVLRLYMSSNEPWLRAVAADAAGRHLSRLWDGLAAQEKESWFALFRRLAYDENPYVRAAALSLMGRLAGGHGDLREQASAAA
ncbi:MAG: HEAT repeat domain-containing protein, partial [Nitrospinota bacterium]